MVISTDLRLSNGVLYLWLQTCICNSLTKPYCKVKVAVKQFAFLLPITTITAAPLSSNQELCRKMPLIQHTPADSSQDCKLPNVNNNHCLYLKCLSLSKTIV